ncbi:MAG: hypothetical protein M3336_09645 [Chloroflexota bacterium]|nr:hypothetical protein [Chloroflexota bacterium]
MSMVQGADWTYTEVTKTTPDATTVMEVWTHPSGDAVLRIDDERGRVREERRCAAGLLTFYALGLLIEHRDVSQETCTYDVLDPLNGLWRRISAEGLTPEAAGQSPEGHDLWRFTMPENYEAYSEIVIDSVTKWPVSAELRSGGTATWSYRGRTAADPPPAIGDAAFEVYRELSLEDAARLLGTRSIPSVVGEFELSSTHSVDFVDRPGRPLHALVWRDTGGRQLEIDLNVGMASEADELVTGFRPDTHAYAEFIVVEGPDIITFLGPDEESVLELINSVTPDLTVSR